MSDIPPDFDSISKEHFQDISQTVYAAPEAEDSLVQHLEFIARLIEDAGELPAEPVIAWRDGSQGVKHMAVGTGLTVGRHTGAAGLSMPDDKMLSSKHFTLKISGGTCELEDCNSKNGTRVNKGKDAVHKKTLLDGDLILAGQQIFAFLNPRRQS